MKKTVIKGWVVEWFGAIQLVGTKFPSIYVSKKAAREAFGIEKIKIIPCQIIY